MFNESDEKLEDGGGMEQRGNLLLIMKKIMKTMKKMKIITKKKKISISLFKLYNQYQYLLLLPILELLSMKTETFKFTL